LRGINRHIAQRDVQQGFTQALNRPVALGLERRHEFIAVPRDRWEQAR
jgi:hypothetical protein